MRRSPNRVLFPVRWRDTSGGVFLAVMNSQYLIRPCVVPGHSAEHKFTGTGASVRPGYSVAIFYSLLVGRHGYPRVRGALEYIYLATAVSPWGVHPKGYRECSPGLENAMFPLNLRRNSPNASSTLYRDYMEIFPSDTRYRFLHQKQDTDAIILV